MEMDCGGDYIAKKVGESTTQASEDASKIVDDLHLLTTCGQINRIMTSRADLIGLAPSYGGTGNSGPRGKCGTDA